MSKERYKNMKQVRTLEANCMYSIDCFGDHLAKREGYKSLNGIEAVHYYLVQKYHWLPATVRSMNFEDLDFLLKEEMHGWQLPKEAR
jgi:hypothetical protein